MGKCVGNENEPVAPKTKLGWVIFGERQNTNKYPNITPFSKEFDPENILSQFGKKDHMVY